MGKGHSAMSTNLPKMMYAEEAFATLADGAQLLAEMARESLYQLKQLPPKDIYEWYVRNTVYRFITEEFRGVYEPVEGSTEAVSILASEIEVLLDLMDRQKQFGLMMEVQNMLSTRTLHLPEGYVQTLKTNKLPA